MPLCVYTPASRGFDFSTFFFFLNCLSPPRLRRAVDFFRPLARPADHLVLELRVPGLVAGGHCSGPRRGVRLYHNASCVAASCESYVYHADACVAARVTGCMATLCRQLVYTAGRRPAALLCLVLPAGGRTTGLENSAQALRLVCLAG